MKHISILLFWAILTSCGPRVTTSSVDAIKSTPAPKAPPATHTAYVPQTGDIKIVSTTRQRSYTDPKGEVWRNKNPDVHFAVIRLTTFSSDDINHWFEDGMIHGPTITDELGNNRSSWVIANPEKRKSGWGYVFVFLIDRNTTNLILFVPSSYSALRDSIIKIFLPNSSLPEQDWDEYPSLG